MTDIDPYLLQSLILMPLAVMAIAAMIDCGCLDLNALQNGPERPFGLHFLDLCVAFLLMFAGSIGAAWTWNMLAHSTNVAMAAAEKAMLFQLVGLLPAVLYVILRVLWQPQGLLKLGLIPRRPAAELRAAGLALAAALPIVWAVNSLATLIALHRHEQLPDSGHELLSILKKPHPPAATAMLIVSAVVVAPLIEETIYRGLLQTALQNALADKRRWVTIMLAAALFTLAHWANVPWVVMPGLFALGLILGWLYERTGSLLPGVLVHGGFNAINLMLVVLTGKLS